MGAAIAAAALPAAQASAATASQVFTSAGEHGFRMPVL